MAQDSAMRARVAGKERTAARTVWSVEIGPLRARCLRDGDGYLVQGRTERGWSDEIARGTGPLDLLRLIVGSVGVAKAVAASAERAVP
jgi:hypothetical protein